MNLKATNWGLMMVLAGLLSVRPLAAQPLVVQYNFTNNPDGGNPQNLTWVGNSFYGATYSGGTALSGSLFKFAADGSNYTNFFSFNYTSSGGSPNNLLVAGNVIYGTTLNGGTNNYGTLYSVGTDGSGFTLLRTFSNPPDSGYPRGGFTLGGDTLYGTSTSGGTNSMGTIFKIGTNGANFAILRSFTNTPDGSATRGTLLLKDATLYGASYSGGKYGFGGIFKLNTNGGDFKMIYNFSNYPDASFPDTDLILYSNRLYGTASSGGVSNYGCIFGLDTNGSAYSVLHNFTGPTDAQTNSDGSTPNGLLTVTNGYLFGTAFGGGANNYGTVYMLRTDGSNFTVLYSFTGNADGGFPRSSVYWSGATLWGTTFFGGTYNLGTIYSLSLKPFFTVQPVSLTVTNGNAANFSAIVSNLTGSIKYQWYFNTNTPLAGETNGTLALNSAITSQSGFYTLVASNQFSAVTSAPAQLTVVVSAKPAIIAPPQNITVTNGNTASFTVNATGQGTLSYQWYFNTNTVLVGQTATNLVLVNVTTNLVGFYTVVVTNLAGAVTSSPAQLSVVSKPTILTQPQSRSATNADVVNFFVVANGDAPLSYQWYFNTNTLLVGQTATNLFLPSATTNQAGSYSVVVANNFGATTSSPAILTVSSASKPIITDQPIALILTNGAVTTFNVTAVGQSPLRYQWYFNTNLANTNLIGIVFGNRTNSTLLFTNVATNTGYYTVIVSNSLGRATSSPALLTVISRPVITNQPQDRTVTNGDSATFSADAIGAGVLRYQWLFRTNTLVAGATNATLTLTNIGTNLAGVYSLRVTNTFGAVTSSFALLSVISQPSIITQPTSRTATNGNPTSFNVNATGGGTLVYQWYFNTNTLLAGQTATNFDIAAVSTNDAGYYTVVVANEVGSVTSSPALLTISLNSQPIIIEQPTNAITTNTGSATFNVTAIGLSPLRYQWYWNTNLTNISLVGTLLTARTNNSLILTNATTNSGFYTVIVSNFLGRATSSPALLTVIRAPIITTNPSDISVLGGSPASFTVGVLGVSPLTFQWYFNTNTVLTNQLGNALAGRTNQILDFASASNELAGRYSVIITNIFGRATSSPALLTLQPGSPPIITLNPLSRTITNGDAAIFTAAASGTNPLSYQWLFNTNVALADATNTTLTFATANQPGTYAMRVTNIYGAATSTPAVLTVVGRPLMLTSGIDPVSGKFTFSFVNLAGSTNRLWATTNLALANAWQAIATNFMATNGIWLFTDPSTVQTNALRLYRFSTP